MSDIRLRLTLSYVAIVALTLLLVGGVFLLLANQYAERINRDSFSSVVEEVLPLLERLEETPTDEAARIEIENRLKQDGIAVRRVLAPVEPGFPEPPPLPAPDFGSADIGRMMRFTDRFPPEPPRMNPTRQIELRGDSLMVLRIPVPRRNEPAGTVVLEFTRPSNFASTLVRTAELGFVIAAGLALLVSGFAGVLVARHISRPIRALAEFVAVVEPGVPALGFEPSGPKEVRELGRCFAEMTRRLSASYSDLAAERDGLREFFSDASHELRTPLTALRNFIEIVGGPAGANEERRERYVSESLVQIGRMERIVGRLLDMARLDGGLRSFVIEETDIVAVVRRALGSIEALPAVETHLEREPEGNGSPKTLNARADAGALEQILANILNNAVRYGRSSDGILRLWVYCGMNQEHTMAFIRIRDAGPGIHPEDIPKLGTRFFRGRNPDGTMPSSEGLGIGLALSMRLCSIMEGFLSVASPPERTECGSGTEVSVFLPVGETKPNS